VLPKSKTTMKLSIYAIRVSKRISGLKVSGQLVAKSVSNNKCYKK
jgi:hypothetical protein